MFTYKYKFVYLHLYECLCMSIFKRLNIILYVYAYNYMSVHTIILFHMHQLMGNYTYSCNILPLNKICLCCVLDIYLYFNDFSTIAIISSLVI